MLSSPYDVSQYLPRGPLRVETAEGRKQFALEQEKLFELSAPLRMRLIEAHEQFLSYFDGGDEEDVSF